MALSSLSLQSFNQNYHSNPHFLAGKITSTRHTKIFYLVAASTLTWIITDLVNTSLELFIDFVVEIDTTALIYLAQVGFLSGFLK